MSARCIGLRRAVAAGMIAALFAGVCFAAAAPSGEPSSSEDIRDIRGPKSVVPTWVLPALLAGAALLAAGAYGVWRRRNRHRRSRALLPFEIALQRLEDARALMQPASAPQFCFAVSDIVRDYIEQGFDVAVTRRTTEEFLRDLLDTSNTALSRHRALLGDFLHRCDYVKFAGVSLTLQTMEALRQSACAFVRETGVPAQVTESGMPLKTAGGKEAHDSLSSA
jgi:hypothetical protein